jgi:hypothetical protein
VPYSYNGWPASRDASAIGIDTNVTAGGRKFPGGVKSGDVSRIFRYLIEQFDRRVEELDLYSPGDEWGYYYRANVNNPSSLSCHASGTAVDINATRHPNGRKGTFSRAQVAAIRQILDELQGVVRWGGDFSGVTDEMHFEIVGSAADAKRVANTLHNSSPLPAPSPEEDLITMAALDRLDALKGTVRIGFRTILLRNPSNQQELDFHVLALASNGYEKWVMMLLDSQEGQIVLAKERREVLGA